MELPNISDPIWEKIVKEEEKIEFDFLATRFFMTRVKIELTKDKSKAKQFADELYHLLNTNLNHPRVKKDIEKILLAI